MFLIKLLFSFNGRINRGQYWLGGLLMTILAGVLAGLYIAILGATFSSDYVRNLQPGSEQLRQLSPLVLPLLGLVGLMFWCSAALYTKRLHDRNKGAIWLLAIYGPGFASLVAPILVVLSFVSMIWVFIELGCLPGTKGPNKFDSANEAAFLDDVFGKAQNQSGDYAQSSSKSYGSMEAAMAAVAEAARAKPAPLAQMRATAPSAPQFGHQAPAQFGRLNTGANSGGFGRRGM